MVNYLISFVAGLLTVISPCMLAVMPAILSSGAISTSIMRPVRIIASLSVSVFVFTLLVKTTSIFLNIPNYMWGIFSGIILLSFGLIMFFPKIWHIISFKLKFNRANGLMNNAKNKEGVWGDVLLGASLGPVFSSCSPTFALG